MKVNETGSYFRLQGKAHIGTTFSIEMKNTQIKNGIDYTPPSATGTLFADMTDSTFWGQAGQK